MLLFKSFRFLRKRYRNVHRVVIHIIVMLRCHGCCHGVLSYEFTCSTHPRRGMECANEKEDRNNTHKKHSHELSGGCQHITHQGIEIRSEITLRSVENRLPICTAQWKNTAAHKKNMGHHHKESKPQKVLGVVASDIF